jgi:hypothetical protein
MASEPLDMNNITEARRKSIAETIGPISIDDMKSLGEQLFPFLDHPWRQEYFGFLQQNPTGRYFHATTHDKIEILYCQDQNRGIWFLPGSGMGPLQETGLKIMQENMAGKRN